MIKQEKFIGKSGLINLFAKEEEKENTLEQIMRELNESSKKFEEERIIFYDRMDKQLEEIRSGLKYTITEQEKQRISSLSMAELLVEIQESVNGIRTDIDTLVERWD